MMIIKVIEPWGFFILMISECCVDRIPPGFRKVEDWCQDMSSGLDCKQLSQDPADDPHGRRIRFAAISDSWWLTAQPAVQSCGTTWLLLWAHCLTCCTRSYSAVASRLLLSDMTWGHWPLCHFPFPPPSFLTASPLTIRQTLHIYQAYCWSTTMASQGTKQWGVTPPISQSLPTEKELAANDALMAELKNQNNFESPEETKRR